MKRDWILFKITFWTKIQHLPVLCDWDIPWRRNYLGGTPYTRRQQAERDMVHLFQEDIYCKPMVCTLCNDPKYHATTTYAKK